jgi:hypothetical protein
MAQWGKTDNYSNSVLWGVTGFNGTPNTGVGSNRQKFYDNNTPNDYIPNLTVGQWGVDPTEIGVTNGPINLVTVTYAGSGYQASPALSSITNGGGTGANLTFTNVGGRVTVGNIVNGGSSYETNPTVTIYAPEVNQFNGNTGISGGGILFTAASSHWQVGDRLTYAGNVTSTPVGLTDQTAYFIQAVNTTVISVAATINGPKITLTGAPYPSASAGGATIQGDRATAVATVGGAQNKGVSHAGWVVRKVGAGGRAGRVQYETLVAMGSITGDGSDDTILPDSNT